VLRNTGTADNTNLVAVLQSSGGVIPEGVTQQTYGPMIGEGSTVSRPFTFRNSGVNGGSITLTLALTDGGRSLGNVATTISIGRQSQRFANTNLIVINDNGVASPYPSIINVSGLAGSPTKVTVTFDGLFHSAVEDVDIMLVAPNGAASIVLSDVGRGSASNLVITLDDTAAATMPSSVVGQPRLVSGVYKPVNYANNERFPAPAPSGPIPKSDLNFSGVNPNGSWALYVVDDTEPSPGELSRGWSITIETSGQLIRPADLGVTIEESADPVLVGDSLTYTLRASNSGPSVAQNITLRQHLPPGVLVESRPPSSVVSGDSFTINIASLGVGESVNFVTKVKPSAAGDVASSAEISFPGIDVFMGNNTVAVLTTIGSINQPVPMQVTRSSANTVRLSWPGPANWILESSASPVGVWAAHTGPAPALSAGVWSVTVDASSHAQFYRLRAP
ncbi:MAG: DUF11 domain-containing protein, partial [Verrucomicrobia bacterium]|nr:DUF11 domain-containing protein [Verrucomicrobiota bacterium]